MIDSNVRHIKLSYVNGVFVLGRIGDFDTFVRACRKAGATHNKKSKNNWFDPAHLPHAMASLTISGFTVLPVPSALEGMAETIKRLEKDAERLDSDHILYPFQKTGVLFLQSRKRCLLADDMGLGKTIQVLRALPEGGATIVVCPAVVKAAWATEIAKWTPHLVATVFKKKKDVRAPLPGEVVILNYELLPYNYRPKKGNEDEELTNAQRAVIRLVSPKVVWKDLLPYTVVVFDEAHYLKTHKSRRTVSAKHIANRCYAVWLLTGTPLMNKPVELWNVLQVAKLAVPAFGDWNNFVRLFQGYQGQFAIEWGEPLPEAAERLYRVALRRRKVDVLKDLPGKSYSVHKTVLKRTRPAPGFPPPLTKEDWKPETFGANDWTWEGDIAKFSKLYAKLSAAKIPAMLEIIEQFEKTETPLVVFSQHRYSIDVLFLREGWAVITGDTSMEDRAKIIVDFQAGKLLGLGCTIQAANTGITLTHASHMLFVSRNFTPAVNAQAEDRINRIGQRSGCQYIHIVSDHPLDERIQDILGMKQDLVDAVIEVDVEQTDLLARTRELYEHAKGALS